MELVSHFAVLYWTVLLICSTYYAFHVTTIPVLEEASIEPLVDLSRIIGGKEARIEDFPHQVAIVIDSAYFCGGALIARNVVVTAAHCIVNSDPSKYELRGGSNWRTNGTEMVVKEMQVHPGYMNSNASIFDYDIALMWLKEPINSTVMEPIALPPRNWPMVAGSKVNVSGWGGTMQGASSLPEHLRSVEIDVVTQYLCKFVTPNLITVNMWCGGNFLWGGKGTCQGDSGGVAVQENMAVGIVSFGRGCGQPLSPSVFANIAAPAMRDFITEHTGL